MPYHIESIGGKIVANCSYKINDGLLEINGFYYTKGERVDFASKG